jgi:hypothetical protein
MQEQPVTYTSSMYSTGWYPCPKATRGEILYYINGKCHGCFDPTDGTYRLWDQTGGVGKWGKFGDRIADLPASYQGKTTASLNYGVLPEMKKDYPAYTYNGMGVSKSQVVAAITAGLADDSKSPSLVIIDEHKEDRDRVRKDLDSNPSLAPWRGKLRIQDYPPDHWAVKGVGHATNGNPTICLQAAADSEGRGVVMHQQFDYDGAEGLANALRRADPNYNPAATPDLRGGSPTQDPNIMLWIAGVIAVLFILKKD